MLAGIAVGTVLGLVSGNARLVLVEGSVPTAVFGLLCLGSLWSRRPLIFRFALEFMGADTPRGRDFEGLWRYHGFRHAFRLFTVVWGVAYLAEAAARVIIVETTSTATALTVSKVMPYAVGAVLAGWMFPMAGGPSARANGSPPRPRPPPTRGNHRRPRGSHCRARSNQPSAPYRKRQSPQARPTDSADSPSHPGSQLREVVDQLGRRMHLKLAAQSDQPGGQPLHGVGR